MTPVGEHPGVLTGQLGKGGDDGEAEFLDKTHVRLVKRTDHLAAELHDPAVGHGRLLHPAARAVAGLEHHDVGAPLHQVACGAKAGESSAHDHDVGFHGRILS